MNIGVLAQDVGGGLLLGLFMLLSLLLFGIGLVRFFKDNFPKVDSDSIQEPLTLLGRLAGFVLKGAGSLIALGFSIIFIGCLVLYLFSLFMR